MRPDRTVMAPPAFDDDLNFSEGIEDLAVEQLIAQARVEAFDVAVLPRTAALDPSLDGLGDELGPSTRPGLALVGERKAGERPALLAHGNSPPAADKSWCGRYSSRHATAPHRLMRFCLFCGIARERDRHPDGFAPISNHAPSSCGSRTRGATAYLLIWSGARAGARRRKMLGIRPCLLSSKAWRKFASNINARLVRNFAGIPSMVVQNRLLAGMAPETFDHLRPWLQPIALKRRAILQEYDVWQDKDWNVCPLA